MRWNSEAGRVSGVIIRKVTSDRKFKGYTHHASRNEPQYMIKSDKTDHIAIHKGPALRLIPRQTRKGGRHTTKRGIADVSSLCKEPCSLASAPQWAISSPMFRPTQIMLVNARARSRYRRSTGIHSHRRDRNVSYPAPNADAESHQFLTGFPISRLSLAAGRESIVEEQGVICSDI